MVIAFANNQVIAANNVATNTIFTDPVPLNDNDRATCHLMVEYIFNAGAGGVAYQGQVSNDGVNWVDVSGLSDSATAATPTGPQAVVHAVNGAFLRFKLSFQASAAAVGACCFDLHVMLDHV